MRSPRVLLFAVALLSWSIGDGRAAEVAVPSTVIDEAILDALGERGVDVADAVVDLTMPVVDLMMPADGDVIADRVGYQPQSRRFTAVIAVRSGDTVLQRRAVSGRVLRQVALPVLARRLDRDETIGEDDIRWLEVRDRRVPANAVVDAAALVGRVGRRPLRAGVPILASDVRRPVLVARGSLVTMVLEAASLSLTARGRALEDAGDGDAVRVSNLQSGQIVVGTVTGVGRVDIARPMTLPKDDAR